MVEGDKNMSKKDYIRKSMLERQDEARTTRKIMMMIIGALVIILAASALGGYIYVKSALKPLDPDDKVKRKIEIPIGSSVGTITSILEKKGIVKNGRIFKYYIKFKNESGFQAGTYQLSPSMSLEEILDGIKSGKVMSEAALKITIPEGKQLSQIATIIADQTGGNPKEVLKRLDSKELIEAMQASHPDLLTDEIYKKAIVHPLEGYLYPATYSFEDPNPPLEAVVDEMLVKTEKVLSEYQEDMTAKKYSPHILLTLASLVEEEATEHVDRAKIASVFFNRLKADMPLQTDPTVLYAKGQHQSKVLYKDLKVESPYNTYKNKGLPPGPIANAGETSIKAALQPDKTKYLYFLATSSGKVLFSTTLEEHNKKKAKYITDDAK